MNRIIVFLLVVLPVVCVWGNQELSPAPNEAARYYNQAVAAYDAKDYAKSIELCYQALEKGAKRGAVPYHMACCFALMAQPDDAFKYLQIAIERDFRNVEHLRSDPDLKSLHGDSRWQAMVRTCEEARDKQFDSLKEPQLARELLRRMAVDQRARLALEEKFRNLPPGQVGVPLHDLPDDLNMERIDRENTVYMKAVIETHGWPGKSLVGEEAAEAAWLLVQHADLDPEFQARCLALVQEAFKTGEVTGQQTAYLTDRVLLKQGKKQLYGTQFMGGSSELKPQPIEDEANLDARRKKMGLGPMAEYEKLMRGGR